MIYEFYGKLHYLAKKATGKLKAASYRFASVKDDNLSKDSRLLLRSSDFNLFFNERIANEGLSKSDVYPLENIVPLNSFKEFDESFVGEPKRILFSEKGICKEAKLEALWSTFIDNSIIPAGYRNEGLHYAGYIADCGSWCLPSWVWTNASIVRLYCEQRKTKEASALADLLIGLQHECGGWVVRNDYDSEGAIPVLAPNDSSYIANNACLETFLLTKNVKYLKSAEKCADWIIDTARADGLVYVGFDTKRQRWQKNHNIVDIGFTAAFFARLYQTTSKVKYLEFLRKFVFKYIELFYIPSKKGFATSLDANDRQVGGMFGRGQAWALEGLIPAYKVLKDGRIKEAIESTIDTLKRKQLRDGGWAYNLTRPLMGVDCKAVPIIACSILEWCGHDKSAEKALSWCICHTSDSENLTKGGIFSYSVEGAIVHHLYTQTAFVYSSAYAIRLLRYLKCGIEQ